MADHTRDLGVLSRTNLTVQTLAQVKATGPQLPTPSLVTDAVLPEDVASQWREWPSCVTHETADCVGVESEHERDEQVVCVPKRLEGLLADAVVGRGIHQQHAEQHDVASDTSRLGVVNLDRSLGPDLGLLDVVETENMRLVFPVTIRTTKLT